MNHVIPNPAQLTALTDIYNIQYPTKNIVILPSGLVVHRHPKSGGKIIGQVIVIDKWLTCFLIEGPNHSIIRQDHVKSAPTGMELLEARVTELEKLVF